MSSSNRTDRLTSRSGAARAIPGVVASLAVLSLAGYGERALRARCHARSAAVTTVAAATPRAHAARNLAAFGGHCATGGGFCLSSSMCSQHTACVPEAEVTRALDAHTAEDTLPLMPTIASNGSGYGIVWASLSEETAELYFARLDAAGKRIGAPVRVTSGAGLKLLPRLTWTGSGYGLVWTAIDEGDSADVYLARLSTEGALQGSAQRLSSGSALEIGADVVWTGSGFGLTWLKLDSDYTMSLQFGRYSATGERQGDLRAITRNFIGTAVPSISWTGDGYGVAFNTFTPRDEKSATMLARIPGSGQGGTVDRVTQGEGLAGNVALAWNGAQQGLVWEDNLDFEDDEDPTSALAFAAVGSPNVARRHITQNNRLSIMPTLAWSGAAYGLAWTDVADGNLRVLFHRLGRDGAPQGAAMTLNTGLAALMPSLRFNGQEYAAAWVEVGRSGIDLCVSRISTAGQRVGSVSCIGAK